LFVVVDVVVFGVVVVGVVFVVIPSHLVTL
jgi:hypothetical protein